MLSNKLISRKKKLNSISFHTTCEHTNIRTTVGAYGLYHLAYTVSMLLPLYTVEKIRFLTEDLMECVFNHFVIFSSVGNMNFSTALTE